MPHPLNDLREAVEAAAAQLRDGGVALKARPTLERPKKAGFGDYSTNAAMLLAPSLGAKPRDVAERLGVALADRLGDRLERTEVAGPGFLNVVLADSWYLAAIREVLASGETWGRQRRETPLRVNVEFVSANPTGPLTAASGRHAAYGDALSRLLDATGHDVSREYYFNDAGSQIERLGASVRAHARGEPVPEDGYQGAYVAGLAAEIPGAADRDPRELGTAAAALIMEDIRRVLDRYRVHFDTWFLEGTLHEGGVERALEHLRAQGHVFEHEGALWLRTTAFGDDKDRVLLRSTGEPTYFAADVAYLDDKLERGFDKLIYVLGADHHGYIARLQAARAALGVDEDRLEVPILQFVHIVEGGGRASMSKRRGEFVTLDELIGEIGVDATRYFMLQRSHDTTIDLDLDLARSQSSENPVYYIQYAHARIASVLRNGGPELVDAALAARPEGLSLEPAERELVKKLLAYPTEVAEAADRRAPHRIATYALELAQAFTAFYRDCPVLKAEPESLRHLRVQECVVTQRTIAASLGLLGVEAPEHM